MFAVVASAGTTNAGLVDDLASVAAACAEHGVWLHVDGAYGGAALAAPSVRGLFDGIEQADSFIVDPHKWLFAPYDCCALLYRDPEAARAAHSQAAGYLDHDRSRGREPVRPRHPPVSSRAGAAVLVQPCHPRHRQVRRGYRADTRDDAHGGGCDTSLLTTWNSSASQSSRSCCSSGPAGTRTPTRLGQTHCAKEGVILCVPTKWNDRMVLRLAFVNPDTQPARVIEVLETLR